jgi:hypothetical protein
MFFRMGAAAFLEELQAAWLGFGFGFGFGLGLGLGLGLFLEELQAAGRTLTPTLTPTLTLGRDRRSP